MGEVAEEGGEGGVGGDAHFLRRRLREDSQLRTSRNVMAAISLVDSPSDMKAHRRFSLTVNVATAINDNVVLVSVRSGAQVLTFKVALN